MKQGRKSILFNNSNKNNLTNNKLIPYLSMFYKYLHSAAQHCFTAFFRSVKINIKEPAELFFFSLL